MSTKTILIVDDDSMNLKVIMQYIVSSDNNYKTYNAINGELALSIAQTKQPDLIIMDWEMPDMSGIEVIIKLKQNTITKDIPVIMATGVMLSSEDLKIALEAGAIDYIRKPIDETELNARVNSALKLAEYYKSKIEAEQKMTKAIAEQKEKEIEIKNKELTIKIMQLIQRNEINTEIINILKDLEKHHAANENYFMLQQQIIKKLKLSENSLFWEEFENQFAKLHKSFYTNLNQKFPNLTPNEKKLCAYLKLNLNTKEIVLITNKSVRSIEIARTRLREKFMIKGLNIDLHSFLNKITQ